MPRHWKTKCWNKGFTLIEMMIVIAIIGILAAIATPAYQHYIDKSRATALLLKLDDIKNIVAEAQLDSGYRLGNGHAAIGRLTPRANYSLFYVYEFGKNPPAPPFPIPNLTEELLSDPANGIRSISLSSGHIHADAPGQIKIIFYWSNETGKRAALALYEMVKSSCYYKQYGSNSIALYMTM
ncbi:prepilin-type N-terminal cleavage/methylation domain-containing protein [Chitinibacter bivalviorum]|uniref:prepilin-type N-terminal cleavage/methylation domain-containing protein n=1 Tax=Chitinibacter bivalviorum TaxID=2739434 RepID=UPI002483DABD|nr:prepilin-type N-terminal cleavage/methylation domain-containing protein [Chitinibacter bivalviorum]